MAGGAESTRELTGHVMQWLHTSYPKAGQRHECQEIGKALLHWVEYNLVNETA